MRDIATTMTSLTDFFHWWTWKWWSQCAGRSLILKLWQEKDVDTKSTHRLWRDVGSHSSLWSSVKLCCHKRNLEEMPHILSCARYHIIMMHFTLRTSYYKSFLCDYNIETLAIRFAMVKRITITIKISNGLLDQVTDRNTRPSVNYANICLDHLFLFSWFMYKLVWSGKVVYQWLWSLAHSQQPCRCELGHFGTVRTDNRSEWYLQNMFSKVVKHPGLRTISVGHVDLAGWLHEMYPRAVYIYQDICKAFELLYFWQGWISNGLFLDLR